VNFWDLRSRYFYTPDALDRQNQNTEGNENQFNDTSKLPRLTAVREYCDHLTAPMPQETQSLGRRPAAAAGCSYNTKARNSNIKNTNFHTYHVYKQVRPFDGHYTTNVKPILTLMKEETMGWQCNQPCPCSPVVKSLGHHVQ